MTRRPAAVLLDLDGTLVDTEPFHAALYRAMFAARGWDLPAETYARFVGRRGRDVFAALTGPWDGEDPRALEAEVLSFARSVEVVPLPMPGAATLVRALHAAGVPAALVTSATPEWAALLLESVLGVHELLYVRVTGVDVARGKPDPEPFLLACRRLRVAPAGSVAVEDSPAGVRSALAAGVGHVVAVTTSHAPEMLRAAGAHDVRPALPSAAELLG